MAELTIPALIALLSILIFVWLTYQQWKAERASSKREKSVPVPFDRLSSYNELWKLVESLNSALEEGSLSPEEFDEKTLEIDHFLLEYQSYLDAPDTILARAYIDSLYQLSSRAVESGDKRIVRRWHSTGPLSYGAEHWEKHKDVMEAWTTMEELRYRLTDRIRLVLASVK